MGGKKDMVYIFKEMDTIKDSLKKVRKMEKVKKNIMGKFLLEVGLQMKDMEKEF